MDNNDIYHFLLHEKEKQINRVFDWNNKYPPDKEVCVSRNGDYVTIGIWNCPKRQVFFVAQKEYDRYNPYKLEVFEYSIVNAMLDVMFKESKE